MVDKINLTTGLSGVQRTPDINGQPGRANSPQTAPKQGSFASALAEATQKREPFTISSHAQKRLDSSHIRLTDADVQRIDGAVSRASEKGSNQSLVMLDNLALVVSVKNKVVITAVNEARTKEGIFTNIDSVVIA